MTPKRDLNVLFIARKFPPSVGGMEKYANDLYESLNKKLKIHLIKWGGTNKLLPLILPVFFIKACWVLITKKIDIIHIQDGLQAPMGVMLKWLFRKPLCIVIHGLDITFENRFYQYFIPRALKKADHIFCISQAAQGEVIKRGIDRRKTAFIPLGITDDIIVNDKIGAKQQMLEDLELENKTNIILAVGRLVKRKGVHWFIENVLPTIINKFPSTVLVVAGEGEYKPETEISIRNSGLRSNVFLLGRVDNETLKNLYNGADVFVMPNISVNGDMEGFGRVLLEAAVSELPVVATGIEGIKDAIIDNKNGLLINEKNAKEFATAVTGFLGNEKLANNFGKRARKYTLSKYGWDSISERFIEQYEYLLKKKRQNNV